MPSPTRIKAWRSSELDTRLADAAQRDLEQKIDAAKQEAERCGPSQQLLKAKLLTAKEWQRHLDSFDFIKGKANLCEIDELKIYEARLRVRVAETARLSQPS